MTRLRSVVTMMGVVFLALSIYAVAGATGPQPEAPSVDIDAAVTDALAASGQANIFVQFSADPGFSKADGLSWDERGRFVVEALQNVAEHSQSPARVLLASRKVPFQSFYIDNTIYVPDADEKLVADLAALPGVKRLWLEEVFAVPDVEVAKPETMLAAVEWGVAKINADDVWAKGNTGQSIVVANVDTGVRYTHAALVNHYRGKNADGTFTHAYSWYDPTGTYPSAPGDNNGHGTHTMGTMVGGDGAGNQIGVAPGAQWIACKGCTTSSCAGSALTACLQWMLAPGGDAAKRPHVVNNSWGGCVFSDYYRPVIHSLRAAGIYVVFSAGNTSNCGYTTPFCGSVGSPATYKEVTAVGATTSADAMASFSLWGPSKDSTALNEIKPEVSAPGASIRSSVQTGDASYALYSGTSMAAPHVAGAIALVWSGCPALKGNIDATEQLLKDSAVKIAYATACGNEGPGNIPNNAYGYGRVDVLAAVNSCGAPGQPTSTPTVTPIAPTATRTPVLPTATPGTFNTAWVSPAANSVLPGGDGNGLESAAANAYGDDGRYAVDVNSGTTPSTSCTDAGKDSHSFQMYTLSLPVGAAVQGIQVRLDAKVDSTKGTPKICVALSSDGTSWTGYKTTSTLSKQEQTHLLGGVSDLWGRTWSTAEISSLRVRVVNVSGATTTDFSLDWLPIRVYYR